MRGALAVLAVVGCLYFGTGAARDLQPFDSSEFVLNAAQAGVGHPPGQPAYTMVAAALVRIFGGVARPAAVLSWLSVLATVGAALAALRIARRTSHRAQGGATEVSGREPVVWAAVAVALAWLAPGVWDLATRPEVYAPVALLVVAAIGPWIEEGPISRLSALSSGLCIGVAASINPALAALGASLILVLLPSHVRARGARKSAPILLALVAGGLIGLLPYLYLPWAGARAFAGGEDAPLVWGAPLRGPSLLHFLLGRDYRAWRITPGEYVDNLGAAISWLVTEGVAPWALLGALGFALAPLPLSRRVLAPLATLAGLLLVAANHPFVATNPDYAGYLLPSLWLDAIGVALLVHYLQRHLRRPLPGRLHNSTFVQNHNRRRAIAGAALLVLALGGVLAGPPVAARRRGGSDLLRTVAARVLASVPDHGVLLLESDHLVFPCLVLQEVEGARRDVVILDAGWASSGWYWAHLAARHPSLASALPAAATDGAEAFRNLPPREARIAGFLARARRPVAAENARLASLAGGRPQLGGWLSYGASTRPSASDGSGPTVEQEIASLRRSIRPGTLDERVLAHAALTRADDAWLLGDYPAAARRLAAALSEDQLRGLPPVAAPPPGAPPPERTRLTVPRALAEPALLLLRLGDLARATDPPLAAALYERSSIPEADAAVASLLSLRR